MTPPGRILVFHTAFPGDIILTLPLIEALYEAYPQARITAVVVPSASGVLQHHPALHELIIYDKRGKDRGIRGVRVLVERLRHEHFDLAVVPHRSARSALIVRAAGIPRRIGFSTSALRWCLTDVVPYNRSSHEIQRNLDLLRPLGVVPNPRALPRVYPGDGERTRVETLLGDLSRAGRTRIVALAPGSKWPTKRWLPEHFERLASLLIDRGLGVALIGGNEDRGLCDGIAESIGSGGILNTAGELSLLESAELLRRSVVLVSNDSAPVHLSVAVGTPVLALFGPTVPAFGFAPAGPRDEVIEVKDLRCRPCRPLNLRFLPPKMHGGKKCPRRTNKFVCMRGMEAEYVFERVIHTLESIQG